MLLSLMDLQPTQHHLGRIVRVLADKGINVSPRFLVTVDLKAELC